MVWLMSKHSMRCGASSRSSALRKASRRCSMRPVSRARAWMARWAFFSAISIHAFSASKRGDTTPGGRSVISASVSLTASGGRLTRMRAGIGCWL